MKIGKYEVVGELGHGAMGTVYRAKDPRLDRMVAIKLISRAATVDTKLVDLFEKEARSIARLSHPNIVTIFEFDYTDHQPYIVMELLKGSDLTDTARLQTLSAAAKIDIIRQACDGLAHAHDEGLIHRDIKPANMFLTESGVVKLMDFGIARLSSSTKTTGSIMGTPEFMAPERLASGKTDSRSDIFSMGVVLYWVLSGIRPFAGEDLNSTFFRILNQEPADIHVPEASEAQLTEINRVLKKALAKDPALRYQTAYELSADLRRLHQWVIHGREPAPITHTDTQDILPRSAPAVPLTEAIDKTIRKDAPIITRADPTLRTGRRSGLRAGILAIVAVLIAAGGFAVYRLLVHGGSGPNSISAVTEQAPAVEIGIVTGKEKVDWFESYARNFMATPRGAGIKINIISMGSLDAFRAVIEGNQRVQVWAPASELQEDLFVHQWQEKYRQNPIAEEQTLALTPTVMVMWEDRYQLFLKKYRAMTFTTIAQALEARNGWATIAGKPEWGMFKFGFANPWRFNTGLVLLFEMTHEFHRTPGPLTVEQIRDPGILRLLQTYNDHASGLKYESRELLEQMIARGPSSFDAIFTYESLALRYLHEAQSRWGKIRLVYPTYNYWMDNPYYVLNTPWSTPQQQDASRRFLEYLYSVPIQTKMLSLNLRPANPEVSLQAAGNPFQQFKDEGIVMEIQNALESPSAEVVSGMLEDWQKVAGQSQ